MHLNDVFFAVHAALLAALTLIQCFIYERGNQRVSRVCASAIGITIAASCVSFLLVLFDNKKFPLLTFLYWLSWVKMGVTFFKYMPQVRMHADFINSALYDVLNRMMLWTCTLHCCCHGLLANSWSQLFCLQLLPIQL